jgi:hypothetical protein
MVYPESVVTERHSSPLAFRLQHPDADCTTLAACAPRPRIFSRHLLCDAAPTTGLDPPTPSRRPLQYRMMNAAPLRYRMMNKRREAKDLHP